MRLSRVVCRTKVCQISRETRTVRDSPWRTRALIATHNRQMEPDTGPEGASAGVGREFESRSDSSTLPHPAAQERPDGIVARRSRSLAEQKATLRRPTGSADGAEQAAPPHVAESLRDSNSAEQPGTLAARLQTEPETNQRVAPPVPADVAAFRRLLEQARARLPPAPPVT